MGPLTQAKRMLQPRRLLSTCVYLISMVATLAAALALHSVLLCLLCLVVQASAAPRRSQSLSAADPGAAATRPPVLLCARLHVGAGGERPPVPCHAGTLLRRDPAKRNAACAPT
jgi:hypothetical protein